MRYQPFVRAISTIAATLTFACGNLYERLDPESKEGKIYHGVIEAQDPDRCLELEDKYLQGGCITEIAIEKDNSDICLKISTPKRRERCIDLVTNG